MDICRVCRSEGTPENPLFHPCICTGSIRYIHQECLVQWLRYSKKEYCELCKYKFAFKPIYSPDMPNRLPVWDVISGLMKSASKALRYWFQTTVVALAWLVIVPLTACRIYRCLFTGSVGSLLTLPLDMLSTENIVADCFQGFFVVTCTLCAFVSLVWLREQILHGGGPDLIGHEVNIPVPAREAEANLDVGLGANDVEPPQNDNNFVPDVNGEHPEGEQDVDDGDDNDGDQIIDGNNQVQENGWNPIEWDRAAEELTWERLLGLDGSLVFLEHVFWVVSLNTLFILVFAFCPYHIGHFTVVGLKIEDKFVATQFEGLLTTLLGYLIISVTLVVMKKLVSSSTTFKLKRILDLCYMVVKVSLLVVIEIGLFPLTCGWWLDVCSLDMFETSLKDRLASFHLAPGTSMFIHWLVGMVYIFYFASFILLLREVLRPGVLWFLRNLNDPNFNPIHEMIHLPVYRHVRRFLASVVIFGSTVLLMLWLPVKLIKGVLPKFLPYNVVLSSDAPISELSLELLLLQVVLPALLEQGYTRQWMKNFIKGWCISVASLLDLKSYLLGDSGPQEDVNNEADHVHIAPAAEANNAQGVEVNDEADNVNDPIDAPPAQNIEVENVEAVELPDHVEGQVNAERADNLENQPGPANEVRPHGVQNAMLLRGHAAEFQAYEKPSYFEVRLVILLLLVGLTLFLGSSLSYVVPVWIGRQLIALWIKDTKIHELYTAACGLYTCWLALRLLAIFGNWLPQGRRAVINKIMEWLVLVGKSLIVGILLIGVVPLLLGIIFELIVVVPLRVPLEQSPLFFPWQDWALGILHAKIICAITMMSPQWWLRRVIEQVYNQGWRNMHLKFILINLCLPMIGFLSMCIAVPYVVVLSVVTMWDLDIEHQNLLLRRIYPSLLCIASFSALLMFEVKQLKKLYEHIRNDKYLIGQRLVNYENKVVS